MLLKCPYPCLDYFGIWLVPFLCLHSACSFSPCLPPHNFSEREQVSSPKSKVLACSFSSITVYTNYEEKEQPSGPEAMYRIVEQLVAMDATERRALYQLRRQKMLSDKIDCAKLLTYFIENYPQSVIEVKSADDTFWKRFK